MNLDMLRQAMKPLENFGKDEIKVQVENTTVYLKTLLPAEEIACQKYASGVLEQIRAEIDIENDQMSRHGALDYFDKFRTEVIAYAICQVGTTDFRGVKYIETGEFLENGTPKKITKELALRKVIQETWSRAMITICFSRYGDLVTRVSEKAEQIAEKSFADLEAEIARLTEKLEKLEAEKQKRAAGDSSITARQITGLVEVGKTMQGEIDGSIREAERRKAIEEIEKKMQEEQRLQEAQERMQEQPTNVASGQYTTEELPKMPNEVPTAEEVSIPKTRKSVIPEQVPPPTSGPSQEQLIRQARERANQEAISNVQDPLSNATSVGTLGGVEAFRLPSQTISDRGAKPQRENQVQSTINPNFVPRR